ncbi:MAG: bifunctional diaminohydroxyphosphoribosylaminopyrimidine deaminase/5-amino-6-(5-phosphoribosylamino)uracil reductase RibD [Casimicrobiaceae bacterium]
MTEFSAAERAHMTRALALAARGLHTTTPNPRVGCVAVRDGMVIGEGFHLRPGTAHAEVHALNDACARGYDPRGATLFVTLEPCNHHGRTPPCVDAIITAGVARIVAAMSDPNPEAAHGAARLRAAGIDVAFDLCAEDARELNLGFVSRVTRGRPWVRAKIAASVDGRTALANGESQWITATQARADGHAWRARACAILTGIGTVLQDDPQLTVRAIPTPRQPLRVVVDRHGQTPASARVLAEGNVLIITAGERNPEWPEAIEVVPLPDAQGRVDLPAMLRLLGERGINELHVEAGARLNNALLDAHLLDELLLYLAPSIVGDPARGMFERALPLASLAQRTALVWHSIERIGEDLRLLARFAEGGRP